MALGSYSVAHRNGVTDPTTVYLGNNAEVQATVVFGSGRGTVSVGNLSSSGSNDHFTRQITAVAAGSEDSDAVNVAQLKAVVDKIPDMATMTADVSELKKTMSQQGARLDNLEAASAVHKTPITTGRQGLQNSPAD